MNPGIFIKLKAEVILFHGVVSANNESKPVDKNTFPVIVITAIDLYRKKDGSIINTVNKAAVIAVAKTFFKISIFEKLKTSKKPAATVPQKNRLWDKAVRKIIPNTKRVLKPAPAWERFSFFSIWMCLKSFNKLSIVLVIKPSLSFAGE